MQDFVAQLWNVIGAIQISKDGTTLLANLFPVGIVLAVVEVRALAQIPRRRLRFGVYTRVSSAVTAWLAVPAISFIPVLVYAVAVDEPLKGWIAVLAGLFGWLLWAAAFNLLFELVWAARAYDINAIITDVSPRPSKNVPAASLRQQARQRSNARR